VAAEKKLIVVPFEGLIRFLLRPLIRALADWAARIRESSPIEPSAARLIRERMARDTSQWANSHAVAFAFAVAPLTGAIATFGALLTADLPWIIQVAVGAVGGVFGLLLSVAVIALCFLFRAIPAVREERRAEQLTTRAQFEEMDQRLARPNAANLAIETHEERLSNLLSQAENARKYPKPHGLADPINREFSAIRQTLDEYKLSADLEAFTRRASDEMEWDDLQDIVATGKSELQKVSYSIRQVLPMLSD
jgi:hypothetical protein